jgi:replication factor A1
MKIPKTFEEIKEYFGDLIDEVTAKLLESYAEGKPIRLSEALNKTGRVLVEGTVIRVFPVRYFNRNGREGKVGSIILEDDCRVRVNFWNDAAELIEAGDIFEGIKVKIRGYRRGDEINVNNLSEVEVISEFSPIKDLSDKTGKRINLRGWVSGIGDPEKADEIHISDETGRVRVRLEDSSVYRKADIGCYVEAYNVFVVSKSEVYADRNSRVKLGE